MLFAVILTIFYLVAKELIIYLPVFLYEMAGALYVIVDEVANLNWIVIDWDEKIDVPVAVVEDFVVEAMYSLSMMEKRIALVFV